MLGHGAAAAEEGIEPPTTVANGHPLFLGAEQSNGNVADGPASTIQITNGGASHYPDLYDHSPVAPVRQDACTRIFCFIEDLFFLAKIQEAQADGLSVHDLFGASASDARSFAARSSPRPR